MIYRLRFFNKDGVEERVDIRKGLATPVIEVEGTDNPFTLSYNNDKGNKSGIFLTSSFDIEIYETSDFNIDNLKTSNETELAVTYYIDNVVEWKGFIIPDFFSIEVRSNPVITMTASDRIGTLKNVTLSDLPSMISLRELAILCLNKTGLTLPLKTMADFSNGTGVNDFFNSKISTQRLSDTKGRSISCYDILSSILTASNSFLVQRSGAWHIINKIQHEAGSGKLYTGATSFINWSDVIFNFSDISTGGRRTIIPVASTVGVFHEFGGGRVYPENYDFSLNLTGWTAVNGFVAVIDNRKVDNFVRGTGVIPQEWTTNPVFGEPAEKKYLVNDNYGINYDFANKPYLRSSNIPVTYPNISQVKVNVEVHATGPYIDSETYRGETNFAVIASNGTSTLHLTGSGTFETLSGDPFLHKVLFDGDTHLQAVTSSRSVNGVLAVQEGNLSGYNITIRIYGYTKGFTGGRFLVTTLVNSVAVTITDISDEAKGVLYKTERVDNFTKAHDIDTSLFADYLTTGLNGYFYSFPIDDTSLIYNSNNKLTSKWTAYNDPEQLPVLQHVTRQRSRLFSVAHDLLSAEIEVNNFDPLAIFVSCGKRYTVVSGRFNVLKSTLSVELEEVAFQNATVRDFIYSYFGEGDSGIKSIGGISGGGGSGSGGGLTPDQAAILSEVQSLAHDHENKLVLDQVTQEVIDNSLREMIISTDTETELTDENYLSSLRTIKEITERSISKTTDDSASGLITFLKGIKARGLSESDSLKVLEDLAAENGATFGNYITGLLGEGAKIDEYGHGEFDSLFIRKFLEVPELRYNRVSVYTGIRWDTFGAGIIESVAIDKDVNGNDLNTGVITLKLEDGEYGAISEDDLCQGIFHNFTGTNDTVSEDQRNGNFRFKGFNTVYFRVIEILDTSNNGVFRYQLRPESDNWYQQHHPQAFMHFAAYANPSNTTRQACVYTTTEYTIRLDNMTSWEYGEANIYGISGKLAGFKMGDTIFQGHGNVIGNAYIYGHLQGIEEIIREQIQVGGKNLLREHALQFAGKYWGGDAEWKDIDIDTLINILAAENDKIVVTENNLLIEY